MAMDQEIDILQDFSADCRMRGLAEGSIGCYVGRIQHFIRFLQARGKEPLQADRLDVRDYVEQLRDMGNTSRTIRLKLTAISSFYEWLIFESQINSNPVAEVRKRLQNYKTDSERRTHKIISVDEAVDLLQSLVDIRDKTIVLLLLKTGIRRGELISLDVDSINLRDGCITLKPTKKRTNRIVFFDDETAYYLKRWLAIREGRSGSLGPALFLSTFGQRLQRSGIDRIVRRGALLAGLHDTSSDRMEYHFSPHACRHWFTTHLRRAGMPREFIQELRGDVRREAIDIYDHIDKEELRKSYLAHIPQLGV
jgi:integrase/recombinase XerD